MKILLLVVLLLAGCASEPTQTYADFSKQFVPMAPLPHVVFEFDPACNDSGDCIVRETTLEAAALVISRLNDTVDSLVRAANETLTAVSHCEYASQKYKEALSLSERRASKIELISMAKQIITGASCAGLLIWGR